MKSISYDYYYGKQFDAISFSKNANKYFDKNVLTDEYLGFLYKKIVLNEDFHIINEQMKYNLLDLANYIRFNSELNKTEIKVLNEIIRVINTTPITFYDYQCFLAEEFDIRIPDGRIELNFLDDKQIDGLLENIEFDFVVLNSLLCSEEQFNDLIFSDLNLNEYYFCSINKLIEEVPDLVYENMVRIMEVIQINKLYKSRKYRKDIGNYDAKNFKIVIDSGKKLLKRLKK